MVLGMCTPRVLVGINRPITILYPQPRGSLLTSSKFLQHRHLRNFLFHKASLAALNANTRRSNSVALFWQGVERRLDCKQYRDQTFWALRCHILPRELKLSFL